MYLKEVQCTYLKFDNQFEFQIRIIFHFKNANYFSPWIYRFFSEYFTYVVTLAALLRGSL